MTIDKKLKISKVVVTLPANEATRTFIIDAPKDGRIDIQSISTGYVYIRGVGPAGHLYEEVRLPPEQVYSMEMEYFS